MPASRISNRPVPTTAAALRLRLAWVVAAALLLGAAPAAAAVRIGSPDDDPGSAAGPFYRDPSLFVVQIGQMRRLRFPTQAEVGRDPLASFASGSGELFVLSDALGGAASGASSTREAQFRTRLMEVAAVAPAVASAAPEGEDATALAAETTQPLIVTLDADALERRMDTYVGSAESGLADVQQMVLAASPSPIAYITDPSQSGQITVAMLAGAASSAQLFPRLSQQSARVRVAQAEPEAKERSAVAVADAARLVPEPASWVVWCGLALLAAGWSAARRMLPRR